MSYRFLVRLGYKPEDLTLLMIGLKIFIGDNVVPVGFSRLEGNFESWRGKQNCNLLFLGNDPIASLWRGVRTNGPA